MGKPLHPLAAAALFGVPSALFGWALLKDTDLSGWRYRRSETRVGIVEYCERTSHFVGGTPRVAGTGTPIFRHYFVFDDPRTRARLSGVSYQTGVCLEQGRAVTVEHPPGEPSRARIAGQRAKPYSGWLALLGLLPAGGLLLAGFIASHFLLGWPPIAGRRRTPENRRPRPS